MSSGSTPRPRRPETRAGRALSVGFIALLLWASQPAIAAGGLFSSEPTPLPPEQAFRLSARGLDARTLEVRFDVVDGYYLYRDKLAFAVQPGDLLASSRPDLPAGKHKHDDFFGDVEIYRGRVVVKLPLTEAASGRTVQLQTQSQGCADAGLCYPPTVQMLNVAVPSAGGGPGPLVEAPHSRSGLFGK